MIELFIDTSTSISTIALLKDYKVINKKNINSNNDLSNNIFKYINELFSEVNVEPMDVKRIYVGYGPGSFTGVRIGLTIAKTYAYTLNIKLVPISSLQILASTIEEDEIVSLIDARRGYVFACVYDKELNSIIDDCYIDLNYLKEKYPSAKYVSPDKFDFEVTFPQINIERIVNKYKTEEGSLPSDVNPKYLKQTEAEERLNCDRN